ncbi:MAG: filamentous hemagglutinin family protein [Chthoniobacteraceae bacterium]|jgi:filamentous hemagglutinin family protein
MSALTRHSFRLRLLALKLLRRVAVAVVLGGTGARALAGDLLRGGYTPNATQGANPTSFTPPSVSEARANMQDALARATQAIEAVQAMQSAARSLAASAGKNNLGINPNNPSLQLPNVPNGLGIGGLNPAAGQTWTGADQPTEIASKGQTVVTVDQTSPEATLTWTTFNIGSATTLKFDQNKTGTDAEDSIVFNVVDDPSGVPSQILGSIKAAGQVYVINQNGIIFGGASQVNVHALVASSLPINNYLIGVGLVNNPDDQYLFSSLAIPALAVNPTAPTFTPPPPPNTPGGKDGNVTVDAGAVLESPANADGVGGKIALIGPDVTNAGTILTPDGQAILAAGEQVGFLPHAESDPSLRGLDVFVGKGGGTATNTGDILAPEADVTMIGALVEQLGAIEGTTSVSLNGRIDLKADTGTEVVQDPEGQNELVTTEAGNVTFGTSSITEILPEWDSSATITSAEPPPDQALALGSQVNVQGETIHMAGNAELLAPSAAVSMQAGTWLPTGNGDYGFEFAKGQIYLDSGALINVAGSEDVSAPVAQNIVTVQLLGPELADSPLERNSILEGQTIYVDIRDQGVYDGQPWIGTPLADAFGYADLVQYTVGELTTNGGTVAMQAGGSVVMQQGSQVNVSGGWINYTGGVVTTSELISGGYIYPISEATPDLVYDGFLPQFTVSSAKWGYSATYDDPLITDSHYENGYVYGGNGGAVTIIAPSTALDGTLLGLTTNGPRQVGPDSVQAIPSALMLAFEGQNASDQPLYPVYAPTPPAVVFSTQDDLPGAAPFAVDAAGDPAPLSGERTENVVLSPDLFTTDGFGDLTVRNGDGSVTVPAGVTLDAGAGGSVTLAAANMYIDGSIVAPGGTIDLTVYDYSPYSYQLLINGESPVTPPANPSRGNFVLGGAASLDVAGLLIDDRDHAPDADMLPNEISGGSVSIASYSADLEAGSSINVSGGVELDSAGTPAYGAGGSISILAGNDPELPSIVGGRLEFDSSVLGYSGDKGGSLTVQAPQIQIGGETDASGVLLLTPEFFDEGGFASFTLDALGAEKNGQSLPAFTIAPGTVIDPMAESLVALAYAPGGAGLQTAAALLPVGSRTPVSLSFNAPGITDKFSGNPIFIGGFTMGTGAVIETDPLGNVSINAQSVAILGSIYAPGGDVSISGGNTAAAYGLISPTEALPTVYISPQTIISTAGTMIPTPNNEGYITGSIVGGGAISISGNIVAEAGAVLNVSGASATLDEVPNYSDVLLGLSGASDAGLEAEMNGSFKGELLIPTLIESNAGSITLKGKEELFTDATLVGEPGGSEALGGTLTVSSGEFNANPANPLPPSDVTLIVTQNGLTIGGPAPAAGETALGHEVLGPNGQVAAQLGHIAVQSFANGGFGAINLNGSVEFSGPVDISAGESISVATSGFLYGNGAVRLSAPYVALGTEFQPPTPVDEEVSNPPISYNGTAYYFPPTYGTGSLTVTAQLIDVGNLSLQGIGALKLIANDGDIQGDGTLDVAGSIYMKAAQIYPPTETTFTIAAYNYTGAKGSENGSVTIVGSGEQQLPLSAGGTLDIYATDITQDGVLRAPFGTINLGWDGSGSTPIDLLTNAGVDPTQSVTLGKGSVTSVSAVDPLTGQGMTIPYGLVLNGVSWIDPSGVDITSIGAPQKAVNISGENVTEARGATVDIRGGGDLSAYEFVPGVGGDIDILDTTSSYAIIPGYSANYAPYAPFNPDRPTASTEAANLGTDPGYVNNTLAPGDTIYLAASNGLPAGTYTLLPARYAALPGAYLVTPVGGTPGPGGLQPDGSSVVPGYRIGTGQPVVGNYEVEPPAVVANEAQYDTFSGTAFLGANSVARTPADSGQLILQATQGMDLEGAVLSKPLDPDAEGGLVTVDTGAADIFIAGPGQASSAPAGDLVLDSAQLSSIGAQTLLIGGYASTGANGTTVTTEADSIVVDNEGAALSGGDIILVADNVTLDQDASITAAGSSDDLALTVTGDGALLRVSNDASAGIARTGVNTAAAAALTVGEGVTLTGAGVILDSSETSTLDPSAALDAKAVTIDSGLISISLSSAGGATPGGLVLGGNALEQIESHTSALTLLSYSSMDIYGTGDLGSATGFGSLTLSAAEILGFDPSGGTATIAAKNITLNGLADGSAPVASGAPDGTLAFDGGVIRLGSSSLQINRYANVELNGADGIIAENTGSVSTQGALTLTSSLITGAAGSQENISAGGAIDIEGESSKTLVSGGLAASLSITGASIEDDGNIALPSGSITLHATSGDLVIGDSAKTELSVAGTVKNIFDLAQYTSGGTVNLIADQGNVTVGADGTINVSAPVAGGNAGTLDVTTPNGSFVSNGILQAQSGAGGNGGNFSLDVNALPTFSALGTMLDTAGFTNALQIEVGTGDVTVDGVATAQQFDLSTDEGSITVTGIINASGETGGEITLAAAGSVTLNDGAELNASGHKFDDAGKGGSVTLSAGADIDGNASTTAVVDVQTGSTIDLSVAANTANSANLGDFTGTLLIRAPQTVAGTDVQVAPIDGTITGASAIVVEGYRIYDLTASGGEITQALENQIYNDGVNFLGTGGQTTAAYTAMLNRLVGSSGLPIYIETGAEIINRSGDLTLGTPTSNSSSDWDLDNYRFGPDGTAGQLTIRASGNLVFYNSLSDGFNSSLDTATLLTQNTALPASIQSWSYTLTAGANMSAANATEVVAGNGSLELGKNDPTPYATSTAGGDAQTQSIINGYYQVIRTGAGNIEVSAGENVELLNQFATIYTAGTQVADPTMGGEFDVPEPNVAAAADPSVTNLGYPQESPNYPAQYSYAGGNVTIAADNDIAHLTQNGSGQLVEDSELELPNNWLYRRGYYIDSATGQLVSGLSKYGDSASTTWWVDFSNFFEGVGALGGGNVTLTAGDDVANVDAVAPTNARMPMGAPSTAALVELGGGDVTVTAGNDINAGFYYVERGQGTLTAGDEILTNSTRSATLTDIDASLPADSEDAWLPTTLFLGQGNFTVTAAENVLLGPVANVFLMPEGLSNTYWYKSYFSTYGADDSVDVTSLAGNVTLRESATPDGGNGAVPLLETWLSNVDLYTGGADTVSWYEPWLRLDETNVSDFETATSLLPPIVRATALSGDVDVVGDLTLFPSAEGTLDLAAAGSINAVQPNGEGSDNGVQATAWDESIIDVSDAPPSGIPGIDDPFAYESIVGTSRRSNAWVTGENLLEAIDVLFDESGETDATLQTKEELHGESPSGGPLHAGDATPVDLYAENGDISGLTLYSPVETQVIAGKNITDISLYIQNVAASDISVVSAGENIIAYDPDSALRTEAEEPGNFFESPLPNAGDIQISGPGTLEVLAGNNLNLGVGPNYSASTGVGITSIGDQRNPFLPQTGADVITAAGMGPLTDLSTSELGFTAFINQFVTGPNAAAYLAELPSIATDLPSFSGAAGFDKLLPEERDIIALDVFYLVLRDAGRDHNLVGSPGYGNYDAADEAIAELFPNAGTTGDMSLTSREIATENGGNISILDPSGQLTVGVDISGNQPLDQGIFTEDGGNISIYTNGSIVVGTSRIFTLRGGNEILWSTTGNIAAGESPKTVQEAPPTQVIVDPQSANVKTDLGGLATGGGIGVLASVEGVPPGDVDLIAPSGIVNAGDAGIRVTGNLNIAAVQVLNAGNIQVGGASAGVPTTVVVAPNIAALTAAANSAGAGAASATVQAETATTQSSEEGTGNPPTVTVEVLGYGGDDSD